MTQIQIVSSRKGFFEAGVISKKDEARIVNLADPRRANCKPISFDSVVDSTNGKAVFILVHGYNNKFEEIADAYLHISNLLQTSEVKYDQLIGYIWPGGAATYSYLSAKNRATALSPRMSTFLEKICDVASEINIISHSLGCFLTLSTMKKLNKNLSKKIGNIYLMAPAVSNHALSKEKKDFLSASEKEKLIYVFKSADDKVLRSPGFRIAEHGEKALGFTGPEPFNLVWDKTVVVNCSNCNPVIGHSSYSYRSEIYDFIAAKSNVSPTPIELPLI